MKKLMQKKRPGFTLVEMVVVVSILGILSGLGFMKFDQVQEKAKENADYVAATNLATAAKLYLDENPNSGKLTSVGGGSLDKVLELDALVEYVTSIPKPQSIDGNFKIIVSKDRAINISAVTTSGEKEVPIYPKVAQGT